MTRLLFAQEGCSTVRGHLASRGRERNPGCGTVLLDLELWLERTTARLWLIFFAVRGDYLWGFSVLVSGSFAQSTFGNPQ